MFALLTWWCDAADALEGPAYFPLVLIFLVLDFWHFVLKQILCYR